MKKLWQKNTQFNKMAELYTSGENVKLDNKLVAYDVWASIAHAAMLHKIGILTKEEYLTLKKGLKQILLLDNKGEFVVTLGDEDIHTKIEQYLTTHFGELGKKIHTARSRNDQVLVDLRLYSKNVVYDIVNQVFDLTTSLNKAAIANEFVPLPGYTHMQQAMPSSIGMWLGSFAESLLDDLNQLYTAYQINDQSPLGSGAAYGVSLPIDRWYTSSLLGFDKVQNNSLYAQVSRPKAHLAIVQALVQIMLTLSRFAQDVLLFTTSEFNFLDIDTSLCTGSSIMPQKKNVDIMELVRARTHTIIGYEQTIGSISAGLPSGYNSDYAETKEPFIKAIEITQSSIEICKLLANTMKIKKENVQNGCSKELYATHAAYELVKKGMPFRSAYQQIGESLDKLPNYDKAAVLKMSTHVGGTGKLNLLLIDSTLKKMKSKWKKKQSEFQSCIKTLLEKI